MRGRSQGVTGEMRCENSLELNAVIIIPILEQDVVTTHQASFSLLTLSFAPSSMPCPNNSATMSQWPLVAAMCKPVRPFLSVMYTCVKEVQSDASVDKSGRIRIHSKQLMLGYVRLVLIRLGQVGLSEVGLGQVRLNWMRFDQVRMGWVQLGQVRQFASQSLEILNSRRILVSKMNNCAIVLSMLYCVFQIDRTQRRDYCVILYNVQTCIGVYLHS